MSLDTNLIDTSIYQNDIIGYKDGIFESLAATPKSIPANLVEVWCRDTKDDTAIETITHYNRQTLTADTEIFYMQDSKSLNQTLSVSRLAAAKKVTVKDNQDFLLEVYRDQPAAEFGLYKATLQVVLNGQKIKRPTLCRLGGSFDSKIWPALQIVDNNVQTLKVAADLSFFGYTSADTGATLSQLYSANMDGTNQLRVSPNMLIMGVKNFEIVPFSQNMLFWGDPRIAGGIELFKVNRNGTSLNQLNDQIINPLQGQATEIKFTNDGNSVIYRDGQQENSMDIEMWLRTVPLSGGTPVVINAPLPIGGDIGVYDFAISKSFNKVAYLAGGIYPQLFASNFDGTNTKQILTTPTPSGFTIDWYETVKIPDPGDYIFIKTANRQITSQSFSTMVIKIDGSNSFSLPLNYVLLNLDSAGSHALLYDLFNPNNRKIFNLQTATSFDLPSLNLPFFSKDSTALVGIKLLTNGTLQATSISLDQGVESQLCPIANGIDMQIKEIGANEFLISTTNALTQITSFYLKSLSGTCTQKNSIPSTNFKMDEIIISPDRQKIILKITSVVDSKNHDQLYYIPLNGQASFAVNTAVFVGAKIETFLFLKDSRTVIYTGDQLSAGVKNVFKWYAP